MYVTCFGHPSSACLQAEKRLYRHIPQEKYFYYDVLKRQGFWEQQGGTDRRADAWPLHIPYGSQTGEGKFHSKPLSHVTFKINQHVFHHVRPQVLLALSSENNPWYGKKLPMFRRELLSSSSRHKNKYVRLRGSYARRFFSPRSTTCHFKCM